MKPCRSGFSREYIFDVGCVICDKNFSNPIADPMYRLSVSNHCF
jgi:hypothetical protein